MSPGGSAVTSRRRICNFFVKGLPWIYQGQEIGMENYPMQSIDEVDDIASLDAWNVMLRQGVSEEDALRAIERNGRDNARTPFQWSAAANAGFTAGSPWLQVNPNYTKINLEQQAADPSSVFCYYKKLIALRKNPQYCQTLIYGSFDPYLEDRSRVISYLRRSSGQTILVLSNYGKETRTLPLPAPVRKILLDNCEGKDLPFTDSTVTLSGYRTLVLEL